MSSLAPGSQAFTLDFKHAVNRLITYAYVSKAFDPAKPPAQLPASEKVDALWDTGATGSVLSERLATSLALPVIGTGLVLHAGGTSSTNRYIVNVGLPNKVVVCGVVASELIGGHDFDLIIGMDIISSGDFSLTHYNGRTCLSFRIPSCERLDYVSKSGNRLPPGISRNSQCPCGSGKKFKRCCGAGSA